MSYKVTVIGTSSVGKTALTIRLVHDRYNGTLPTIGASFFNYRKAGSTITLNLWDCAGMERTQSLVPLYLRNSQAILVVFEAMQESTLQDIEMVWLPLINAQRHEMPKNVVIYIVASKVDMCSTFEDREFIEKGRALAHKYGHAFWETSAKCNIGISQMFDSLTATLKERFPPTYTDIPRSLVLKDDAASPNEKSCINKCNQ